MMVTFVSQCEKKAIKRTRMVLDAFANRIGDCTWQTIITEDGLAAVKKMLRMSATKNTAVACHWVRSRNRSELIWVVGKRSKFNSQGIVPVNRTNKSLAPWKSSHLWQNLELVAIASGIAGLFHDFGKANDLFQDKISPNIKNKKSFEPYRHEWVSLRIFESFVKNKTDQEWLNELLHPETLNHTQILTDLFCDNCHTNFQHPFKLASMFAQLVAWLIVSHHRLPTYPYFKDSPPTLIPDKNDKNLGDIWMYENFDAKWNSPNSIQHKWVDEQIKQNWTFSLELPSTSIKWQKKAQQLARRALNQSYKLTGFNWQTDLLTTHLARLMLMLSDHWYSSQDITVDWQDNSYKAYANTDKHKNLKQKLDEHNLAVGHYAYLYSRQLPQFLSELPELGINRVLERGIKNSAQNLSLWQNKAFANSQKINIRSNECGFFGINMASTGKGKTFTNARIMYALADQEKGCRFSVALGLRTLTTQTGAALKINLQLDDSEIATLIGSAAIQRLVNAYDNSDKFNKQSKQLLEDLEKMELALRGSESLYQGEEDFEIDYPEIEPDGLLNTWFKNENKLKKLLYAPILVSTIDHLIPATEGIRGGRQIAPMLRLLSSDLILDEPDEFSIDDLPALSRLVNWAGMLGAKVLLSSATIPPAMACALFEAYCAGRQIYNKSMSGHQVSTPIVCAWYDEFSVKTEEYCDFEEYARAHHQFVQCRIKNLLSDKVIVRKAKIVDIEQGNNIIERFSATVRKTIFEAHKTNHQRNAEGVNISLGVIRFANINPLTMVANYLIQQDIPDDYCLHYCVYHSQFTLAQRSNIEEKLDRLLNRKNPDEIWQQPEIITALKRNTKAKHHVFVVLATSVCEVGRDHDYDWAVAEPSSMRSLIQLAGRLQRHRNQPVMNENLFILNSNIRALKGKSIVFTKPGFESEERKLHDNKEIKNLLDLKQYQYINAIPSIESRKLYKSPYVNLVDLEQNAYWMTLLGVPNEKNNARLWWKNSLSWCGELQRQQPFRKSAAEIVLIYAPNSSNQLKWHIQDEYDWKLREANYIDDYGNITIGKNGFIWFECDELQRYEEISELLGSSFEKTYLRYGEVRVPDRQTPQLYYHKFLGVFAETEL